MFLLSNIWSMTWDVAGATLPIWLFVVFAGGIGVVLVFGIIAGLISTSYRKKNKLGKYAPAPDRAVKLKLDGDAKPQKEQQAPKAATEEAPQEQPQAEAPQEDQAAPQEESVDEQPAQEEQPEESQEESENAPQEEEPQEEQAEEIPAEQPAQEAEESKEEPDLADELDVEPEEEPKQEDIEEQIARSSVFQKDTTREELLASMTDTSSLSEFDFDSDFDSWEEMGETPVNAEIEDLDDDELDIVPPASFQVAEDHNYAEGIYVADEVEDPDADIETNLYVADEFVDDDEDDGFNLNESKYLRSFRSRLIQSDDKVKGYYSILKNELLSYKKMRSSEAWNGESFLMGRKTYAKMLVVGKTLSVFLALNPAEFDPRTFHHRDKSDTKKYESTPLLMRITSEQAMRRTLSLIATMAYDNGFVKSGAAAKDYAADLAYKTDEELLAASLIRHNLKAVDELAMPDDPAPAYRSVSIVSKQQVGNLTDEDIAKLHQKGEEAKRVKGKFIITEEGGLFRFNLSVGSQVLFVSGGFKSQAMAIKGVSAYKKVLSDPNTPVKFCVTDGQYFYILKSTRNWISVMYPTKNACVRGYELARAAIAESTIISE